MFAAEFEPAESNGRRRSPRAPVSLDAGIGRAGIGRGELDRAFCKVVDLSRHGARLQTYTALKCGSMIWLTLPRAGQVAATIMWADDFTAGCQFVEPLDRDAFDLVAGPTA